MMLKIVCNKACRVYSLLPALLASFYTTFPLILWAKCTLPFHELLNSLRLYLWANTSLQVASMFPSPPHLNMCVWIFIASSPFASSISHLKCYFFLKVFFWALHLQWGQNPLALLSWISFLPFKLFSLTVSILYVWCFKENNPSVETFERLLYSWWYCLERLRKSALTGGNISLGLGFESLWPLLTFSVVSLLPTCNWVLNS